MDCYSARIARIYGYDFTKTVYRYFESHQHRREIISAINKTDLPFIRMGNSGDPSENWAHTLHICEEIYRGLGAVQLALFRLVVPKWIVIITRHFNQIDNQDLNRLQRYRVCINTSVSAIDTPDDLQRGLNEYRRLQPYCKSVLRVITFDFNEQNERGREYAEIQRRLLNETGIIDTVFRPSKNNPLLNDGIIKAERKRFLGRTTLVSKHDPKIFMGKCQGCTELCGVGKLT
jgi:hypothetical protein